MNKNIIFGIFCLCGATLSSANAFADDAAQLKEKLSQTPTVKANFTQVVTDINQRQIQKAQGILALASPNKLYWHLSSPDESLIVADGKDVWLYNPFAEEVTAMDMKHVISASPIALLVHKDAKTWKNYRIKKNNQCFEITPKVQDTQVTSVNVCFANNTLKSLMIEDSQGNQSRFDLSGQHALSAKDMQLFNFTLPEGVDLDDQRDKG